MVVLYTMLVIIQQFYHVRAKIYYRGAKLGWV